MQTTRSNENNLLRVVALCRLPFLVAQEQSERVEFEIPSVSPKIFLEIGSGIRFGLLWWVMVVRVVVLLLLHRSIGEFNNDKKR